MRRKSTLAACERGPVTRERLGVRLNPHTKRLIERAARLEGLTVTEFCVTAVTQTARHTIERHERLVLSEMDRKAFFDVLMAPPSANERLERAIAATRRRVRA